MSTRLMILAMVLTTVMTLMLMMLLSTTTLAATPDLYAASKAQYQIQSNSMMLALKTLKDAAPLFLGAGALLVSGVFVVAYKIVRP